MSFDLVFSIWLAEIRVLETFFSFISGRVFSFSLFGIFALFMLYQKRHKDLLFVFLALTMISLPVKMYLRWFFNLKYLIAIPEYFFNI